MYSNKTRITHAANIYCIVLVKLPTIALTMHYLLGLWHLEQTTVACPRKIEGRICILASVTFLFSTNGKEFKNFNHFVFLPGDILYRLCGIASQWCQPPNDAHIDCTCAVLVKECKGSLRFIAALRYGTAFESEEGFTPLNLQAVRDVAESTIELRVADHLLVNHDTVKCRFGSWLLNKGLSPFYDVFISHRWHKDDDKVADQLYDAFQVRTVGPEMRAVRAFYYKFSVKATDSEGVWKEDVEKDYLK